MFINERADPVAAPTPSISGTLIPEVPIDRTPMSTFAMIVLKLYAYGGLAFMVGITLTAITYWIWIVVIKREFADSPPELELHPERMRETEKARIERLKARKEEKRRRKINLAHTDQFLIPPLRYEHRNYGRDRSASLPIAPITQNGPSPTTDDVREKKSSLSTSCSKGGKRVSWASSTSSMGVNGNSAKNPLYRKASPAVSLQETPVFTTPVYDSVPTAVPRARTSVQRLSAAIEPRSRYGRDMIAATTANHASGWSSPDDPFHREENIDPFSISWEPNKVASPHRD